MPPQSTNTAEVEARTQQLGKELFAWMHRYHPSPDQRWRDSLMSALMANTALRTSLMRFVDVLAALPENGDSQRTASLFREYFRRDYPSLPVLERLALMAARSPLAPDLAVAALARRAVRLTASRFIVPMKADSIAGTIQKLAAGDRNVSFDLLGEAILSEAEAQRYRQAYLDLIDGLSLLPQSKQRTPSGRPCLEVSLKLSSLTAQFNPADPEGTLRRVRPGLEEICEAARERGIGVTIDAEQYAYRELIWYIFQRVLSPGEPMGQWQDAGMVLQAYLRDVDAHTRGVIQFARRRSIPFQVRLVKGAYWDYEVIQARQHSWLAPVYQDKGATDQAYERVVGTILVNPSLVQLAVGSHNIRAHAYAESVREARGLPLETLEHQTLYRTLEPLSRALPHLGWSTRDYVPMGDLIPGMAYLVRRILENTSQVGFLTRARQDEDPRELLAPPRLMGEDHSYRRPSHPNGFINTPHSRLFDADERQAFAEALGSTRARWGQIYPLRIGDTEVVTSDLLPSTSPSHAMSGEPVGWVHQAGIEETEGAIKLANEASTRWAARTLADRVDIGLRAAGLLTCRKNEVAAWVVHEGGRTWEEALADVEEAIDHIQWNSLEVRRLGPQIQSNFRPRGVVACIPPWNFPTALPAAMTSAALVTGNSVILKSAGQTPVIAQALVNAFYDAGVPRDTLVHLPGAGETVGARLVESPDIDMVAFTGSKKVGLWIYQAAASVAPTRGGIKRVVAEMGGKNAIVVFPEADMDEAVSGILESAFAHAGQKCSACSRVLVHREIHDRLTSRLTAAARGLPVGPADQPGIMINPVIDPTARKRIVSAAAEARKAGRVLLDLLDGQGTPGTGLGPLIIDIGTEAAEAAMVTQEEIFGPVLPILSFETEDEAVSIVNSTVYALTLGIYSRSPATISRMIKDCRAGNIYVNRRITGARVGIEPFGGFQLSGTGPKTGGEEYVLAFMTRRQEYRSVIPVDVAAVDQEPGGSAGFIFPDSLRPWDWVSVIERQVCLTAALETISRDDSGLTDVLGQWKGVGPGESALLADRMIDVSRKVLAAVSEIAQAQLTVKIPGQTNYLRWDTPRGIGLAAVDDGAGPAELAALLFGALLAGNGVMVSSGPRSYPAAQLMIDSLIACGVPTDAVYLAPRGISPEVLAAGPISFAGISLGQDATRAVYRVLGVTNENSGQRWLKALISLNESHQPGEAGFLRLFAHPRTIAVQTLRHGADLELT